MQSKKPFVVELGGNMTIVQAKTLKKAQSYARTEWGRMVESVKPATEEDVSWVQAMGGRIHEV